MLHLLWVFFSRGKSVSGHFSSLGFLPLPTDFSANDIVGLIKQMDIFVRSVALRPPSFF